MTPRATWAGCAATGVVAFLCSWAFGWIGLVACGPTGGLGPIIAFELARAPADVAALFGSEPCRSALVAAQKTGLVLDGLGFIPFYTAFLIFGAAATGLRGWQKIAVFAAIALAGLGDEIEGYILRQILNGLPGTDGQIDTLFWVVRGKFALLGLGTLAIGGALLATRRLPAIASGVAIGAGALIALNGLANAPDPRMMSGFAIAWVMLLLTAIIAVWRPLLFSRVLFSPAHVAPPPRRASPSA